MPLSIQLYSGQVGYWLPAAVLTSSLESFTLQLPCFRMARQLGLTRPAYEATRTSHDVVFSVVDTGSGELDSLFTKDGR